MPSLVGDEDRLDDRIVFFFNDTATTEIYTLSLHDALPISPFDRLALFFFLKYPMRSSTARTINGSATVASSNTSANRPPSSGGTNFPHETASVYVLPLSPPQCTGSGQMRTP